MLTEKSVNIGPTVLNYAEGPRSGPPLVFFHGATLNWQSFYPLIPHLMQSWHVFACDTRGHGKSGRVPNGYRWRDIATEASIFLRFIVNEPAVIVGHSMGGVIAMCVASTNPSQARGLVMLDPGVAIREVGIEAFPEIQGWIHATKLVGDGQLSVRDMVMQAFPLIDEQIRLGMEQMVSSVDPGFCNTMLNNESLADLDLEEAARKVRCPSLLLKGQTELGSVVRPADIEFLKMAMPQLMWDEVAPAGHMLQSEQPEQVLLRISRFAESL